MYRVQSRHYRAEIPHRRHIEIEVKALNQPHSNQIIDKHQIHAFGADNSVTMTPIMVECVKSRGKFMVSVLRKMGGITVIMKHKMGNGIKCGWLLLCAKWREKKRNGDTGEPMEMFTWFKDNVYRSSSLFIHKMRSRKHILPIFSKSFVLHTLSQNRNRKKCNKVLG